MKISLTLIDDQYPKCGTAHKRIIARAILFDEKGNICLHTVSRDDAFGKQTYFETPGGGIEKKETLVEGLLREIKEEVGCKAEILEELGVVKDSYNLISRRNENHYFLAKVISFGQNNLVSSGDFLIKETKFYPPEKAIELMENQEDSGVSILVKRRELPFLKLGKSRIGYYLNKKELK